MALEIFVLGMMVNMFFALALEQYDMFSVLGALVGISGIVLGAKWGSKE